MGKSTLLMNVTDGDLSLEKLSQKILELRERRLSWAGHVKRRHKNLPVHQGGILEMRAARERPKNSRKAAMDKEGKCVV